MSSFQKILVPIDFSELTPQVLHAAAELSRRFEAPATLLHIWDPEFFAVPNIYRLYDPKLVPGLHNRLMQLLERARHDMQADGALQVDIALVEGQPHREIVRFAHDSAFDLIVIGTHGRTGLAHSLLGSVAEKVVRLADCAVMTVHHVDRVRHAGAALTQQALQTPAAAFEPER
ncbi:MAG TPA: universal stress protein [Polyangiales bacterium]|jgi:nucleotide-binding universal stress UspA family protein|nr:universal stress protein [Polyangiales bacterium]